VVLDSLILLHAGGRSGVRLWALPDRPRPLSDCGVGDVTAASSRGSVRSIGIDAFHRFRALRGVILALPLANFLAIGFPLGTGRLAGLVEICISPFLAGLSDFLTIGGAPLALELSAFLGVCVRH
jgi:hypothetical protein